MVLKASSFGEVMRFDVARSLLGRGRYWTTCYLVDGLMIDTGCAHCAEETATAVAESPLRTIVNSHTHEDHIGANGRLQRRRDGVEIFAHPLALQVLADPRTEQPLHPYRRIMWGWPEPSRAEALENGQVLRTPSHSFQVVFTPGHGDDHLCLFEPDTGWLFTGDLFVGGRDRALGQSYDVWGIIRSLKLLATLPATILFPGSARVRREPKSALSDRIAYLEALGERVLELHRQGRSVSRIASQLCGPPMFIEILTLGHFSRRHLVKSYIRQQK